MAERYFSAHKETQTKSTSPVQRPSLINKIVTRFNEWRKNKGILFLGRMPDISDVWYFTAKSWLKKQQEWDWVISSYAPYSTLLLGRYLKKAGKCKRLLLDFRDPWSNHHLFPGVPFLRLLENKLEKKCIEVADVLTAASPELLERYSKTYPSITVKAVVLNGYFQGNDSEFKKAVSSDLTITHMGSIYLNKHSPASFFKAVAAFKHQHRINLKLSWAGNEKLYLDKLAGNNGLSGIWQHYGHVDFKTSKDIVSRAHLGVVFDSNSLAFNGVLPVKVFDYMAFGLPILVIGKYGRSDLIEILKAYENYWFVGEKHSEIVVALEEIYRLNFPKVQPPEQFSRDYQNRQLLRLLKANEKN